MRKLITIAATLLLVACGSDQAETPDAAPVEAPANSVTIMAFNVENLFDNRDDPGKNDATYLPLAAKQTDEHQAGCATIEVDRWREQCESWDWSDEIVDRKLAAVAGAILQVNNGQGPDIVALQEVENIEILQRLIDEHMPDAGYTPILVEGYDVRGIDVAFLSRLPTVGEPVLHPLPSEGIDAARYGDTRGVLEATFELPDGSLLTGYSVHFPAPFHPSLMRVVAYNHLNYLKSTLPADRYAFAAGDFNTPTREDREQDMLGRLARPYWTVVHDFGCGDCRGTNYYAREDSWSFLDMILFRPCCGENATWQVRADSVRIANGTPAQVRPDGTPQRFEITGNSGVSDHWPVLMTLERRP